MIVFAASRQQYGRPQFVPVTEDHPLVPVDVNGINLIAGESYHLLYHDVYGIRAASLRLTNTYGPHLLMKHGRQGFITMFIRLALEGEDRSRSSATAASCATSPTSPTPSTRSCAPALTDEAYGQRAERRRASSRSRCSRSRGSARSSRARAARVETVPWPPERKKIDIGSIYVDHARLTELTGWEPRVGLREGPRRDVRVLPRARRALPRLSLSSGCARRPVRAKAKEARVMIGKRNGLFALGRVEIEIWSELRKRSRKSLRTEMHP